MVGSGSGAHFLHSVAFRVLNVTRFLGFEVRTYMLVVCPKPGGPSSLSGCNAKVGVGAGRGGFGGWGPKTRRP